ncbi:MAG: outer membrane protein assembly factor BamE [Alphaproteobacteria bacterium]|nr:outer membrane protein assembly factor BamE [Alphaproteobacteria bacterium]
MRLLVALVISVPLLSSCAVYMAASGEKEPDLGAIKTGATRSDVELHLGEPVSSSEMPDGRRYAVYEYQIGNEPSTGRAVAHGTMDVLTLGLWEIIGTPIEGLSGDTNRLAVTYNEFWQVEEVKALREK